ncbi:hypothetical protein K502DRAFT_327540 [Neoconidiobolus thromboides FSU 785]|nr:hypothetical protein K502DRAFT_327540 [Neoconidiobolus thromboides FSU 785]
MYSFLIIAFLATAVISSDITSPLFTNGKCAKINNKLYTFGDEYTERNHYWNINNTVYSLDLNAAVDPKSSNRQWESLIQWEKPVSQFLIYSGAGSDKSRIINIFFVSNGPSVYYYNINNKSWNAKESSISSFNEAANISEANNDVFADPSRFVVSQSDINLDEYFVYVTKMESKGKNNFTDRILVYNEKENSWRLIKDKLNYTGVPIMEAYNGILYLINGDNNQNSDKSFVTSIKLSDNDASTKLIIGTSPRKLGKVNRTHTRNKNLIYLVSEKPFELHTFDLEKLTWSQPYITEIEVMVRCAVFHNDHLLLPFATCKDGDKVTPIFFLKSGFLIDELTYQPNYETRNNIIGGVVGGVLGLLLIIFGIYYYIRRKNNKPIIPNFFKKDKKGFVNDTF